MINILFCLKVTDSPYVVASMGIMTRMGTPVLNKLSEGAEFVRCQHSVGRPLPLKGNILRARDELLRCFLLPTRAHTFPHAGISLSYSPSGQLVALQPGAGADRSPAGHQADHVLRQWLWRELSPGEEVLRPPHRLAHRQG